MKSTARKTGLGFLSMVLAAGAGTIGLGSAIPAVNPPAGGAAKAELIAASVEHSGVSERIAMDRDRLPSWHELHDPRRARRIYDASVPRLGNRPLRRPTKLASDLLDPTADRRNPKAGSFAPSGAIHDGPEAKLAGYGAQFELSVELASGLEINVYRSDYGSGKKLMLDAKALDALAQQTLFLMASMDSPYRDRLVDLAIDAKEGRLDALISLVVIDEGDYCIGGYVAADGGIMDPHLIPSGPAPTPCVIGLNTRDYEPGIPSGNQIVVLTNVGAREHLSANLQMSRLLGHELGHVFFGMTTANATVDHTQEHELIHSLEEALYHYLRDAAPRHAGALSPFILG